MRALTFLGAAAFALASLTGCSSTSGLSGTVTTTEAAAFAPDATVQVTLMDASGSVVARNSMPVAGRRLPIPFTLSPSQPLAESGRYEMRAMVISRTGQILYRSDQSVPVTMNDNGTINVLVQPAGS